MAASNAVIMVFLLPVVLLLIAGCGDTVELPQEPPDALSIEQAAVTEVGSFVADDLPTDPGSTFLYMTNIPGTAADVSFDLDGPWNFTTGPTAADLTIALMDPAKAPVKASFPDATLVAVTTWSSSSSGSSGSTSTSATVTNYAPAAQPEEIAPRDGLYLYSSSDRILGQNPSNTVTNAANSAYSPAPARSSSFNDLGSAAAVGGNNAGAQSGSAFSQYGASQAQYMVTSSEYNFQDKSDNAWRSFGRLGPEERLRTYSTGVNVLKFPMGVGSTWTENYTQTEDGKSVDITAENTVLAEGRVRVPAGAFNNGILLQNKVTVTSGRQSTVTWDYIWFVPGVGRVAEIISQPGEKKDVFHTARSFYRLQEYHLP